MSEATGGVAPVLPGTIDAVGASSMVGYLGLEIIHRLRPAARGRSLLTLAGGLAYLALWYFVNPRLGVLWTVPVVIVAGIMIQARLTVWVLQGGDRFAVSVRPGGVDLTTGTVQRSYPSAQIARWAVTGRCLSLTTAERQTILVDLSRHGAVPESAVTELLAMDPVERARPPRTRLATTVSTAASSRRSRTCVRRLVPSERWRFSFHLLVTELIVIVPVVLAALAIRILDNGRSAGIEQFVAAAPKLVAITVIVTSAVLIIPEAAARKSRDHGAAGHRSEVFVDRQGMESIDDAGIGTRIRWAEVDRVQVDADRIELVTKAPRASWSGAVDTMVAGGAAWLVVVLESRGASPPPLPVPSAPSEGERPMGERS